MSVVGSLKKNEASLLNTEVRLKVENKLLLLTWSNLKAAAKLELLFNKSASEANLLNTKSSLSRTTKCDQNITLAIVTLVTLHFATKIQLIDSLHW